jgi:ribosomally synthesized peptide (two-chain TOMM family)
MNNDKSVGRTPPVGMPFKQKFPAGLDALLRFRLLYMRAIAQAWAEPDTFGRSLQEASESDGDGRVVSVLQAKFGDDVWPWSNSVDLRLDLSPNFVWAGNDWFWSEDGDGGDQLVLRIPRRPLAQATTIGETSTPVPPEKYVTAFVDYYAARPTLFGDGDAPDTALSPKLKAVARKSFAAFGSLEGALQSFAPSGGASFSMQTAGSGPPQGGFIGSAETFLDFNVAVLSVMVKAWESPTFARVLTQDAVASLTTVRGYQAPWKLDIHVEFDHDARWTEGGEKPWHPLKPHMLKLHMPARPERPEDWPVALAAYNATGAEYPFTCCTCAC